MASSLSIALGRGRAPTLLSKLLRPVCSASVAPSVSRSFSINSQVADYQDTDGSVDVGRRSDESLSRRGGDQVPGFFTDVFDPFSPTRSLSQVLNMMDQFMANPFMGGVGSGARRGWDVKEDENGLYLRMDMPGLGKEDVKVWVEQNTLIIKGEAGNVSEEEEENKRRFSTRLDLPPNVYKADSIKAEMKNGVLKVLVPKVKAEERKDVLQVKVE
ncbi:hypothetical protein FNV43_RR09059 [Rhamnella rubrinervis]|uniref:SHSP domain-containing protein n=1 Tax=Rhamnella rubrinervis TaxID=2594499 RepID=A0A8K0H9R2_9ROSA|nr:hypothetical protein FNV43_RR09059 [Rhamnella rubrinervis]